jgi:HPt (histidine-containing phosphotransfer) domain-containing protein
MRGIVVILTADLREKLERAQRKVLQQADMDARVIIGETQGPSTILQPANARPIDLAHLSRYTLGNRALQCEVLQLFIEQAPMTLGQLNSAETQKAWRDAAHTLKGSARAVGAWRVAHYAERAEGLDVRAQEKAPVIQGLEAALEEARRYIAGLAEQA